MRVVEQCMDTNSANEESKISRIARLKMAMKSGVKVWQEYFSSKNSLKFTLI